MASGFGFRGGTSRCYPFWMDFMQCLQSNSNPQKCTNVLADYEECLHHKRELIRASAIAEQKAKYIANLQPGEQLPGAEMREKIGFSTPEEQQKRYPHDSYNW